MEITQIEIKQTEIKDRKMQLKDYIIDTLSSQDFSQRIYLIMNVSIELYRVLVSTLLIIFIPQNCDGKLCTMKQNLESKDYTYNVGLTFNFITLGAFIILYMFEISREHYLIKYLEVNPRNPRDNESLQKIFDKIPTKYHDKIYRVDYYYQKICYICLLLFTVNIIISGIVIYQYSLGNQTTTNYITNVLFMTTKVYDTFYVANTERSIFYSAYMRDHVQFNDIDPHLNKKLSITLCNPSQYELFSTIKEEFKEEFGEPEIKVVNDEHDENIYQSNNRENVEIILNEIIDQVIDEVMKMEAENMVKV
jgi:hypothetical protein